MRKVAPQLLLVLLCMSLAISATAQRRGNLASSVGLSGGYVEDGYGGMATFNFHPNRYKYFQVSVLAAFAEDKGTSDIPYNIFTIQPGLFYRAYISPKRKSFSLHLGGGGLFGYEIINNPSNNVVVMYPNAEGSRREESLKLREHRSNVAVQIFQTSILSHLFQLLLKILPESTKKAK